MADEEWTVVGRRRAARIRKSRSAFPAGMPSLQVEECDTSLLLLRLKRSMARVQESAFFQRFLLQVQSAPFCGLLSRAMLISCSQRPHGLHDDDALHHNFGLSSDEPPDGSAERFVQKCARSNQNVSRPSRGLVAENPDNFTVATLLNAFEASVCDRLQNVPEASISSSNTLAGTNTITPEYKCTAGPCRYSCGSVVASSTFSLQVKKARCCLDVILYGLGSIAYSEASRCQLALILLLKERFSWVGIIEVYDPVLTLSELAVIKEMGCVPVALNENGRRSIVGPTLFYMPHCEDWLYDNILQANWAPCTLRQIVILGNSFQAYQERWSSPAGRKSTRPSYVLQYQQFAKEVPLEATSASDLPGFNNMSWHFYELCSNL